MTLFKKKKFDLICDGIVLMLNLIIIIIITIIFLKKIVIKKNYPTHGSNLITLSWVEPL